jgi:methionyl aminopeptidase
MEVAKKCLEVGIAEVRPGSRTGNIGYAIHRYAASHGFSVVHQFCGHGVGLEFHEEPQINHISPRDSGPVMREGMVFTVEPMINEGVPTAIIDSHDRWTARTEDGKLSAQYEHTILVVHNGYEILTQGEGD